VLNGKHGDHPVTDIVIHKLPVFSNDVDQWIVEIAKLGGMGTLNRSNWFPPPPLPELEVSLMEIRDRLLKQAKERGWEL